MKPGPSPRGAAAGRGAALCAQLTCDSVPPVPPTPRGAGSCLAALACDVDASVWRDRLHRAPDRCSDGDVARLLRMSVFLVLLFTGYAVTRGIAQQGLPSDGRRVWLGGDLAADVVRLLESGVALGWMLRVDDAERARWLCSRQVALPLLLAFFAVSPVYSALNQVPGLQVSLSNLSVWSGSAWAAIGLGAAVVTAVLSWHVAHAWRSLSRPACAAYLASRVAPFVFYGVAVGAAARAYADGHELRNGHLHHLYLAWAFAAWGRFNHPVSGVTLAVAAGIFVQGVGAYGFDPLVVDAGCKNMKLPEHLASSIAYAAGCKWNRQLVGDSVRVRVCPGDAAALAQSNYMRCIKRSTSLLG